MKRKYKVTVNGETFEVEVEETTEEAPTTPRVASIEVMRRSVEPRETVQKVVAPSTVMEKGVVTAPLPGVVSSVHISAGDEIKAGTVLLVLEAMKMENEIYAPADGVVSEVYVEAGQQVGRGHRLVKLS
jgi:biotin carboxyl carrier protein